MSGDGSRCHNMNYRQENRPLVFNSYAKVNLSLTVLNKRKDGYHNIKTIFERISLSDRIILKLRRDSKINIISAAEGLPKDKTKNLAYRSAELLQKKFNINKGVDIKILKRIPLGSGLGGGSSNAACVLSGLNQLWGLNLSRDKLARLAARLGSDVPFFIYDTAFAQGSGRGDKIKPFKAKNNFSLWHILVVPEIQVSTPLIYHKWDACLAADRRFSGLTRRQYDDKILTLGLKTESLSLIAKSMFNSLEEVTFNLYPGIRSIKEKLLNSGVKAALMSGSGSAVFAIVSSRREAGLFCRKMRRLNRHWQVFPVRTV